MPQPQNEIHPCDIRIDKEGTWFFRGAEMFRKDIVRLLADNMSRDEKGRYLIEYNGERCWLEVDDTPFAVRSVTAVPEAISRGEYLIKLNEGSEELLDAETLWIGESNVMYCLVRRRAFAARFTRAAYYQLAAFIDYDEDSGIPYLRGGERRFAIRAAGDCAGRPGS